MEQLAGFYVSRGRRRRIRGWLSGGGLARRQNRSLGIQGRRSLTRIGLMGLSVSCTLPATRQCPMSALSRELPTRWELTPAPKYHALTAPSAKTEFVGRLRLLANRDKRWSALRALVPPGGGGYARYLEAKAVVPERGDYYLSADGSDPQRSRCRTSTTGSAKATSSRSQPSTDQQAGRASRTTAAQKSPTSLLTVA